MADDFASFTRGLESPAPHSALAVHSNSTDLAASWCASSAAAEPFLSPFPAIGANARLAERSRYSDRGSQLPFRIPRPPMAPCDGPLGH